MAPWNCSLCTKFVLSPPAWCSVCGPLCLLLARWFQVKTWRGTTALPPGPTSCLLVCTTSCAEERRALKYAAPPESRFDWTTDSFSHFSISAVNAGAWSGCPRVSTAGLFIKTGCILFRPGREMTLSDLHRRTRKTPVYFLSWANSDICLFPLHPCTSFFLSFSFSFLSVFSDLCLTERVRVNSQDGCTGSAEDEHFYTNTHEYLNVYRSRRWTVPPFIHTDSGGLMRHPLVALWSSSVKVYALSHVGKDPPGLFLLSSMILFTGCWCLSSVL